METNPLIGITLSNWDSQVKRITTAFDNYKDEDMYLQVAPGRNRIIYILGHMTAVHDMLLPLLGLGERRYPNLDEFFITHPDSPETALPMPGELRTYWKDVNAAISAAFRQLSAEEWLDRHTMVTPEEFEKEPHRNRFNVLLSRLTHISYHLGQLALVNK
ncbi:DinB superfamily protein [Chitinophaga jiangningensis]|uniref:DinB superfamily protein n=1 Tax=Chitinophaga jiangningensis TaxID=1419482 RepID=A0A1M7LK92_9BACT|nr:DinB family protein [Chitinophaga jiangningensis]SHM78547.1 DinB superfamily protein [Chitinophaga jiangningensis]